MRLKLRGKFLLPTIILVVLGMGVSAVVSYVNVSKAMEEAVVGRIDQIAGSTTELIAAWNGERFREIGYWSKNEVLVRCFKDGYVAELARKTANEEILAG